MTESSVTSSPERDRLINQWGQEFKMVDTAVIASLATHVVEGASTEAAAKYALAEMNTHSEVANAVHDAASAECVLYYTSMSSSLKVKSDCRRLKQLLDALKIRYSEVDISENKWLRDKLLSGEGDSRPAPDLPVLSVGDVVLGDWDYLGELHDDGEFLPLLKEKGYR